jgi:probable F420-dependent oxidoreductase
MELGRVGIWSLDFLVHPDGGEIGDAAAELEQLGFGALFVPGWLGGGDVFPSYRRVLAATSAIPVVSGIVNVWRHPPEEVAAESAALERDHPGRFQLGLGISHPSLLERGRYRRPLATMRAYLDELEQADVPVPVERRLLAALGPRMLDLARERTAGSHPYFVPVEHTRSARKSLGPEGTIAVQQFALLETDPTAAREAARASMADCLELPNYVNNLLRHGFDEDDLRDGGSVRLVDAMVAWADEDAIARRVGGHLEAGADHVCLEVIEPGRSLPLPAWRRLASLAV